MPLLDGKLNEDIDKDYDKILLESSDSSEIL